MKLPMYMLPVTDAMAWKDDAFQHRLDVLNIYAFPLFVFLV